MSQSADHAAIISRLAPVYQPSPVASRRNLEKQRSTSPRSTLRKFNSAVKLNEEQVTPPGSPPSFRRSGSRDETGKNVFHRWVKCFHVSPRTLFVSRSEYPNHKPFLLKTFLVHTNLISSVEMACPLITLDKSSLLELSMSKNSVQLNEYETDPYFCQFSHRNTTVCLIIHTFCKSCELDIDLLVL